MAGYSATQIYEMLHSGPGTTGIYHASDGAATQMSTQDDLNNQIVQLNQKMGGAWTGAAAEQAQAGATPLAGAAQDATTALSVHQSVMTGQAEAFTSARNSVTNVPSSMPNNIGNDFLAAFGDTGPLDDQVTQYNNASQNNVQVYQTYSTMSSVNADSMPQSYGQIPVTNATITVVGPSSTGASGGYAGTSSVAAIAGGNAAEREAALGRLTGAPGANGSSGASSLDETSGAIGTPGGPPTGGSNFRLPGVPNEPNIGTNAQGFVPTALEEDMPIGGIPGAGRNGNNNDDEAAPPPPNFGQNFSGDLTGGPGGVPGGGGSQAAMDSLHGGAGLGTGSGASNLTASSSRSTLGMASQATEESMMGGPGGGIGGPGGAPGEEGPMGGGASGRREEDGEHKAASYLQEADPDALFGTDEMTAPPVIGE
jgi:hypothetical protein